MTKKTAWCIRAQAFVILLAVASTRSPILGVCSAVITVVCEASRIRRLLRK